MAKITLERGIQVSKIVLELLRENSSLDERDDIHITVGCFVNCRETGYTFRVFTEGGREFTWCVYEHRNSDQIILNGKTGYVCMNGELPYKSEVSKWDYIKAFSRNEYEECADYLAEQIIGFVDMLK